MITVLPDVSLACSGDGGDTRLAMPLVYITIVVGIGVGPLGPKA